MSRYLKQYEKEHMKMAMLKQEETFKQQVQELHRLYRVQKLLMPAGSSSATTMAGGIISCRAEDEENEAGSSRPWDAYRASEKQLVPTVLEESELELTLGIGSFGRTTTTTTTGEANDAAKKEAPSSSVDSRTSNSSSSTESGSPNCRAMLPQHHHRPSRLGSSSAVKVAGSGVGSTQQHSELEQDALKQPPWLHQCLNLAR